MEQECLSEQTPNKKGRQRKKQFYTSILQLMEFYFSDANLSKDRFLSQLLETDSSVDVNIFLKFNKIRRLTSSCDDIIKALKKSTMLILSEDELKVSRVNPVLIKDNIDKCTIYVENIKSDTMHDWLKDLFSDFGKVDYISIPKYKHNKVNKGFAFIEFATEEAASDAVKYFEEIGAKMSSTIAPENLQSIATFESEETVGKSVPDAEESSSKRKLEEDKESEEIPKKLKLDQEAVESLETDVSSKIIDATENGEKHKKKKPKSKKSKKKSIIKELGLQVLPKNEWKKLRNQYLDMQKKKMKQLKMHLNKRKFTNKYDNRVKTMETPPRLPESENPTEDEKLKFIPGVLVKFKPFDISSDAKQLKIDLKSQTTGIKYVDLPHEVGNAEIHVRFTDAEQATKFLSNGLSHFGEGALLEGDDEQAYWSKIKDDRQFKLKKGLTKGRGREKLLKKAERELGKHIRFDDDPDD